jgi:hypothetical protein
MSTQRPRRRLPTAVLEKARALAEAEQLARPAPPQAPRSTLARNSVRPGPPGRDASARSTLARDTAARDTATRDTATRDTATRDTATRDTATRDTATRDTATRNSMAPGGQATGSRAAMKAKITSALRKLHPMD